MSRTSSLTRKPTLLTALLSAATIAGYVAFRFTLGADDAADPSLAAIGADHDGEADHDHDVPPPLADAMPAIVLDDLAGNPTALASFAGKPLLINFWATWCAPCRREIPMLKIFHDEQPDITVIGIAYDRLDPVLEYAEEMQFNYPALVGQTPAFEAMAAFQNDAGALPFTVYIAPDGAVLGKKAGELHEEDLENFVATVAALAAGDIDRDGARAMLAGLR